MDRKVAWMLETRNEYRISWKLGIWKSRKGMERWVFRKISCKDERWVELTWD
jgi:hypothetical protein